MSVVVGGWWLDPWVVWLYFGWLGIYVCVCMCVGCVGCVVCSIRIVCVVYVCSVVVCCVGTTIQS